MPQNYFTPYVVRNHKYKIDGTTAHNLPHFSSWTETIIFCCRWLAIQKSNQQFTLKFLHTFSGKIYLESSSLELSFGFQTIGAFILYSTDFFFLFSLFFGLGRWFFSNLSLAEIKDYSARPCSIIVPGNISLLILFASFWHWDTLHFPTCTVF